MVVFDLPLELEETRYTTVNLGVVPAAADVNAMNERVHDGREAVALTEVGRDKDLIYLVAVTMKEDQEDVLSILKRTATRRRRLRAGQGLPRKTKRESSRRSRKRKTGASRWKRRFLIWKA